ncbi:hypothetical protein SEA_EULA_48 [Microbacterium phage Eula]|uniref:hypothetical protein n=1 Tax=Microbacterium phage Arroyo TaxID=2591213 RepID=UPI0010C45EB7|nr:hypothetical protein QDW24_gp48 [Microbacterium phage Arroyo]YP_010753129.1 hypothetical protein QDW33_gp46 [Microbacterium phage Doobus]YP_010753199.1 hypothetical protein QDW34_gp48 [Microbacterium phage Burritobowl]YP_010753335.1 hypothetical protein QDW36_gp46 [Microbacterium phage Avocadoman]YP_010753405.1 hypothetical protein QDW37_gp47 [Microbacterium phage Abigail]YP_010753475.1 hypothetical protein QDW38_gp49 [Microbacterium phage Lynlen]YP_010753613.1 hypothetical protein QDW40_g
MNETKQAKSRSGRAVKLRCVAGEDYLVSTSRSRVTQFGTPLCPCHKRKMEEV